MNLPLTNSFRWAWQYGPPALRVKLAQVPMRVQRLGVRGLAGAMLYVKAECEAWYRTGDRHASLVRPIWDGTDFTLLPIAEVTDIVLALQEEMDTPNEEENDDA